MRRTMVVTIALTIVTLATLFGAKAVAASPSHSSKADAQDAFIRNCTDYYNQRAWTYLQAHCYDAKSFIDHTPEAGQAPTWEGYKGITNSEDVAFPDWKTTIVNLTAQGNRVVMQFVGTGTQTGPLGKLPATGHRVSITGMRMFRIDHGRITDTWVNYDELGLLQQLGVVARFSTN